MHIDTKQLVIAAGVLLASPLAGADAGIDVSGSAAREDYVFAHGEGTVDWQKVTVRPWWANDQWRLEAEVPYLQRDASASGTINVRRWIGGKWVLVPLAVNYQQSDSSVGDSYLRATRSWKASEVFTPYLTGELKLPTGNPDPAGGTVIVGSNTYTSSRTTRGNFSFGNDSTDFRLAPGMTLANDMAWFTAEAGYTWSEPGEIPVEDRPMAYAGIGLTPARWLELAAEFDYEGEVVTGGDTLEQWTYTLTLRPTHAVALTLSTYQLDSKTAPDTNWTLGAVFNL